MSINNSDDEEEFDPYEPAPEQEYDLDDEDADEGVEEEDHYYCYRCNEESTLRYLCWECCSTLKVDANHNHLVEVLIMDGYYPRYCDWYPKLPFEFDVLVDVYIDTGL